MALALTFLGAARTVTGSRMLLETSQANILIDCGLYQEREYQNRNWTDFGFNPSKIDAVLLTHGHLDHCGWLPKLVKEGFRGRVYTTQVTSELVGIILMDSARIQEEDAKTKNKRHRREGRPEKTEPMYTEREAERAIRLLKSAELSMPVEVAPGVTAEWNVNGHILGASWISVKADGKNVVFSGDIGRWDRPIIKDPQPPQAADYLIMESTYGDRFHDTSEDASTRIAAIIADSARRGGNLLIPSFSVERAQEILYMMAHLRENGTLVHTSVYVDSPMAMEVTRVFKRHPEVYDDEMRRLVNNGKSPFSFDGLHYVTSREESKRINDIKGGVVIIAGSGMCTGGRIKHHLMQNLDKPEATVLFTGYQANGTLGRQLVEGREQVRLFNQQVPVRAKIDQIHGLSGHADQNELLRWAGEMKNPPRHCFVNHGGTGVSAAFAAKLTEKYGWSTSNPAMGTRVELD